MVSTKRRVSVGVVGLGKGLSTVVFAQPLKAGATVVGVGPVVSVSLSLLFAEILSAFLVGSGGGRPGFGRLANRRFHAS